MGQWDALHASILEGIPETLPEHPGYDKNVDHAPIRRDILTPKEKQLALKNALRYFPSSQHEVLAIEFANELDNELHDEKANSFHIFECFVNSKY